MEFEIAGNYPIILDGETAGEIHISRNGLFWSFEGRCDMHEEIVRLSVYGDGKEGYLGVMEPCGEVLLLKKKLSRGAMSDFPQTITHGGQKGEAEPYTAELYVSPQLSSDTLQYGGEFPLSYYSKNSFADTSPLDENKPPPNVNSRPPVILSELAWSPCACPCSLFTGLEEKKVCSYISGAFAAIDGENLLLAVPEDNAAQLPNPAAISFVDKIIFSGKTYLICKIEHGKSVSEL